MYKSFIIFMFCVFIWGMYSLSYATKEINTSSTVKSTSNISNDIIDMVNTVESMGIQIYKATDSWYYKHNTKITILPDLLRVPMIDCVAVLLGIFLWFFAIIRYLSR